MLLSPLSCLNMIQSHKFFIEYTLECKSRTCPEAQAEPIVCYHG
jgi:hypothetical protein